MNTYGSKNNGYYQSRPQQYQQPRRQEQEYTQLKIYETQLPHNEIRISNKGNVISYSNVVCSIIKSQGYQHCKLVGRGMATEKALDVMRLIKNREPNFWVEQSFTKAINKNGDLVDEVHVMIMANRQQSHQNYSQQYERYGYQS